MLKMKIFEGTVVGFDDHRNYKGIQDAFTKLRSWEKKSARDIVGISVSNVGLGHIPVIIVFHREERSREE